MGQKYSTISTMKSLLTDDCDKCINCGKWATDCHHIFEGPDKRWSEKFSLMIPLCHKCHMILHECQEMNLFYKRRGQEAFEREHPDEMFTYYFRKNYTEEKK